MKKPFVIIMLFLAVKCVYADEGMWLLPLVEKLNHKQMMELGAELTPREIYNTDGPSISDAIVVFGPGCTGEFISDKGLILTNHHCGESYVQGLSSLENNYLKDGYWAMTLEDEIPVEGLTVKTMESFSDITEIISAQVDGSLKGAERAKALKAVTDSIKNAEDTLANFQVLIKPIFQGNQYIKITYKIYRDVRLVGTPPLSIGNFGDETDNWMWPRHTGDFNLYRVYADKDGNPVKYSEDNVPFKPEYSLPISLKGYTEGDFSMTIGFPGTTIRNLPSFEIKARRDIINKARIEIRGLKQDIWKSYMRKDEETNLKYANKYSRSSNYWKNSIGMNRGIKNLNVIERKKELEEKLQTWINENPDRKETYGDLLAKLEEVNQKREPYLHNQYFLNESLISGVEIFEFAHNFGRLGEVLQINKFNPEYLEGLIENLKAETEDFFKNYDKRVDREVFTALGEYYYEAIPKDDQPEIFAQKAGKYKGDFTKFSRKLFAKSMFDDREKIQDFLKNPAKNKLLNDPVFRLQKSIYNKKHDVDFKLSELDVQLRNDALRMFAKAVREMDETRIKYPDANFTMRLSYGKIEGYSPSDAVYYRYFTTLKGVMEKENPNDPEFVVADKLKELYYAKSYGKYAASEDTLRICFISDNDITGGNSGSPVIDGKGRLIGLAFDGNWEAMSGDIEFEPELQRCINVDIRYVLFVIDKFAGAKRIIDELKLVN